MILFLGRLEAYLFSVFSSQILLIIMELSNFLREICLIYSRLSEVRALEFRQEQLAFGLKYLSSFATQSPFYTQKLAPPTLKLF